MKEKGFTLVELLVVIAIIGILASIVTVSLSSSQARTRDAKRLAELKQIQNAILLYKTKTGSYPVANGTTRTDSCDPAGTSLSVPFGDWSSASGLMSQLIAQGIVPAAINDPVNTGYATSNSLCYQYSTQPTQSEWNRCRLTETPTFAYVSDYEYAIFFATESPVSGYYRYNWSGTAGVSANSSTYDYCILGPRR